MRSFTFSPAVRRTALIALNAVAGVSPRTAYKLSQQADLFDRWKGFSLPDAAAAMEISDKALVNWIALVESGFGEREELKAAETAARIITIIDEDYPQRLKEIIDPPVVLYVKGRLPAVDDAVIALVGARQATAYGLAVAEQLSMRLAEVGVAVISGMARGIDAAAHRGALKACGRTYGVLGCGLDIVYPVQNQELSRKTAEQGCLISEFPFGTEPLPYHFPRRNRIVSALSQGVVVVEANAKSGALITADFALEQGRDVLAVPGRIDSPQSFGPHQLIRNGAKIVLSVEDILEDIVGLKVQQELFQEKVSKRPADLTVHEDRVLSIIEEGTASFDSLVSRSALSVPVLMGVCLSLQLRRVIQERPGKIYEII